MDIVLSRVVLGAARFDVRCLVLTKNPSSPKMTWNASSYSRRLAPEGVHDSPASSLSSATWMATASPTSSSSPATTAVACSITKAASCGATRIPEEGAEQRGGFEAPGLCGTSIAMGVAEAVHYQLAEGKEWLVVSDGLTGRTAKFNTEWPTIADAA